MTRVQRNYRIDINKWAALLAVLALVFCFACEAPATPQKSEVTANRNTALAATTAEAKKPTPTNSVSSTSASPNDAKENTPAEPPILPSMAGGFYPGDATELRRMVSDLLEKAKPQTIGELWGILVPHAGYVFSGPVAASAYRQLQGRDIHRVVVVAFTHDPFTPDGNFKLQAVGTTTAPAFRTPLGDLPVDVEEVRKLLDGYPFIREQRSLFGGEHSLEVQLPFIQTVLPKAKIVPLMFGIQSNPGLAEMLADVLAQRYAIHRDTLVIATTDLSHFHPYRTANRMDKDAVDLIRNLNGPGLLAASVDKKVEICGPMPVLSMILAQQQLGKKVPLLLDMRNSGDTFGEKKSVVGYAALAFQRSPKTVQQLREKGNTMEYTLSTEQQARLLAIARRSVSSYVVTRSKPAFEIEDELLLQKGAAFVTLKIDNNLRGCIGHTEAHVPLWECVRDMAIAAASQDPRFPPVDESELERLSYEVTVLTPLQPVEDVNKIQIGRDGLMMQKGPYRGLLLPQVPVEWCWDREQFLQHTAQKAGLPMDAWKDKGVTIFKFQGIIFSDADHSNK